MSNSNMTQVKRLLDYMESHRTVNTFDAMIDLGIARLSARVYEIRHTLGRTVYERRSRRLNRFGEVCTVWEYSLFPFEAAQ